MKNIKWISITSCISIFLLTLALLTINNTFSFSSIEGKWDVHFESANESVIIDDTRIDFYNTLKVGETYKLDVDVVNNGTYNTEIYKVIPADLKKYKLENSDYTLDDFLSYSYNYAANPVPTVPVSQPFIQPTGPPVIQVPPSQPMAPVYDYPSPNEIQTNQQTIIQ